MRALLAILILLLAAAGLALATGVIEPDPGVKEGEDASRAVAEDIDRRHEGEDGYDIELGKISPGDISDLVAEDDTEESTTAQGSGGANKAPVRTNEPAAPIPSAP